MADSGGEAQRCWLQPKYAAAPERVLSQGKLERSAGLCDYELISPQKDQSESKRGQKDIAKNIVANILNTLACQQNGRMGDFRQQEKGKEITVNHVNL